MQRVAGTGVQVGCLTGALLRVLREAPRTRAKGLRVCRLPGHTVFPFSRPGPQPCALNLSGVLERVIYGRERCPNWTKRWEKRNSHFRGRGVFSFLVLLQEDEKSCFVLTAQIVFLNI